MQADIVAMDARENILLRQILRIPCFTVYPRELILITVTIYVRYYDAFLYCNHAFIHYFDNFYIVSNYYNSRPPFVNFL